MKETNFFHYSAFRTASNFTKAGFQLSNNIKVTNILARVASLENLIAAYKAIKPKPNNSAPSPTPEIRDKVTIQKLQVLSSDILNYRFEFKSSYQAIAPGPQANVPPLITPSFINKIVRQSIKQQLDLLFDPLFLDCSHGFRPGRRRHSALNQIKTQFNGVNWAIEGNIRNCFQNIKFDTLYALIERHVADNGFKILTQKLYQSRHMTNNHKKGSDENMQNRSVWLTFINIALHELDCLIIEKTGHIHLQYKAPYQGPKYPKPLPQHITKRSGQISADQISFRQNNTQVQYIRYATKFIIGVAGNKGLCKSLTKKVSTFLQQHLGLSLFEDRTKITNLISDRAIFLDVWIYSASRFPLPYKKGTIPAPHVVISAPVFELINRLINQGIGQKLQKGRWKPCYVGCLVHAPDEVIIKEFAYKWLKIWDYYKVCDNASHISHIIYLLKYSCAARLSMKHKKTLRSYKKVFKKYGKDLTVIKSGKVLATFPSPPCFTSPHFCAGLKLKPAL